MLKSDSAKDWYYMDLTLKTPISVTHEILQSGRQFSISRTKKARKQLSLQSYNAKDYRLDCENRDFEAEDTNQVSATSTYARDFTLPYSSTCPPKPAIDDFVDPLFNRRTQNAFQMLPWAPGKFMDDHFAQPSEERKRIDFFRQIRQMSYFDKTRE